LSSRAEQVDSLAEAVSVFTRTIGGQQIGAEGAAVIVSDGERSSFYVFFKRTWFRSYQNQFPQERGKGYGQSVSLNILKKATSKSATIIIVLPDGKIYSLPAQNWLEYAETHRTIRRARDGDITASVPANLLQRWSGRE